MMIRKLPTGLVSLCLFLPFHAALTFAQQASTGTAQPQSAPAPSPKPAPAAAPETPLNTSDNQVSLQLFYWDVFEQPDLRGGAANVGPYPGNLKYPGSPKRSPGVGAERTGWQEQHAAHFLLSHTGQRKHVRPRIPDAIQHRLQSRRLPGVPATRCKTSSFPTTFSRILIPPIPPGSGLRRYGRCSTPRSQTSIDAPLKPIATDASGNPISNTATGTRWLIYPSYRWRPSRRH